MAYTRTYATNWPLLDFFFRVWKLQTAIVLMSPSVESMSYQYLALIARWGNKQLFIFRLYDTDRRVMNHFDPLLHEPYDLKRLQEIKKTAIQEIKRLKNSRKPYGVRQKANKAKKEVGNV